MNHEEFKDSRPADAIRKTAEPGIVFYWYPFGDKYPGVYRCVEIFEDGEMVIAWSAYGNTEVWGIEEISLEKIKPIWEQASKMLHGEL